MNERLFDRLDVRLLPSAQEDREFLEQLFREVRTPEFAQLRLPPAALDELLLMQLTAQRSGYLSQFPHAVDRVVWVGEQRVGRLLVDRNAGGMQIVDIALLERFRGQGLGTQLLRDLSAEADAAGIGIGLSVRLDNPAERLYLRSGFVRTASDGLHITMVRSGVNTVRKIPESGPAEQWDDTASVTPGLNSRYFRLMQGATFIARNTIYGAPHAPVALTLESVSPLRAGLLPRYAGQDIGDSFRIIFTGPAVPVLQGALTELTPDGVKGAVSQEVFLSPVAERDGGIEYEAIFNRATL